MIHKIDKQNIFNFLKSENIVRKINDGFVEIIEEKNKNKLDILYKVSIKNLNKNNQYWEINPENPTYIRSSKPTERVILEQTDDILNIVFIEMKSKISKDISQKFERTLSWLYLLLNLLDGKQNQKVKVYYIVCKLSDVQNQTKKEKVQIFSSTEIRYNKKWFYSKDKEMEVEWKNMIV